MSEQRDADTDIRSDSTGRAGWFGDLHRGSASDPDWDLCPNCVTSERCTGPHLWPDEAIALRAQALGALRRGVTLARFWEDCNTTECPHGDVPHDLVADEIRTALRMAIDSPRLWEPVDPEPVSEPGWLLITERLDNSRPRQIEVFADRHEAERVFFSRHDPRGQDVRLTLVRSDMADPVALCRPQ